jgi:hypothetical protein
MAYAELPMCFAMEQLAYPKRQSMELRRIPRGKEGQCERHICTSIVQPSEWSITVIAVEQEMIARLPDMQSQRL